MDLKTQNFILLKFSGNLGWMLRGREYEGKNVKGVKFFPRGTYQLELLIPFYLPIYLPRYIII